METSQTSSSGTGAKPDLQRDQKHSGDMHYRADGEQVDAEGLDATLKKKLDAKYDVAMEAEVREWMGGLLGEPVEGDFMEVLKDGTVLCKLVNAIKPGIVKKINKMKMPFMQMENIGSFLAAVYVLGVSASESFMTVDLYEAKNPGAVLLCLDSLKRNTSGAASTGEAFAGAKDPHSAVCKLQSVQRGKRQRARTNELGMQGLLPGQQETSEPGPDSASAAEPAPTPAPEPAPVQAAVDELGQPPAGVAPKPAAGLDLAPETSQTSSSGTGAKPDLQRDQKHSGDMHYRADGEQVDAEGLDATLKKKLDAKYDVAMEAEVREWMGGLLGEPVEGDFMEVLKDGTVLCKLVNAIKPGIVKKINKMKMPFMQMENIGSFLAAVYVLGVSASESFMTVDLYEAKNPGAVLLCLDSLKRSTA